MIYFFSTQQSRSIKPWNSTLPDPTDPCWKDLGFHKLAKMTRVFTFGSEGTGNLLVSTSWFLFGGRHSYSPSVLTFVIGLRALQEQHGTSRITTAADCARLLPARPAETANWILIETKVPAAVSGMSTEMGLREWRFTAVVRNSGNYSSTRCRFTHGCSALLF